MDLKVGFIGAGNMGCAMIKSIVNSKFIKRKIFLFMILTKGNCQILNQRQVLPF